jgi:hypothetical protein
MNFTTRAALLVVASLCLVLACQAQTQFPDTPSGNQTKAWLAAFNAGDPQKYKDFVQANFPTRAERADQDLGFREATGGLELKKIEESTPTKTVAIMQERLSDQMGRLTVEVEAAEPHKITALGLRAIPRPAEFAIPHLAEAELINAVRAKMNEESTSGRFAGAVAMAKNGKQIFGQAYGLADRENKLPNTMKTRFRLGSMNKMFTAVATMQLVQSGKLDLKAPFGKYLTNAHRRNGRHLRT